MSSSAHIDDDAPYDESFLEQRRADLRAQRAAILDRSTSTLEHIRAMDREVGDSVDTSNEEQDLSSMLQLTGREKLNLASVDEAIARLDDDAYGECVECGEWIRPRRLEVKPEAALCIDCQDAMERRDRGAPSVRPGLIDE